MEGRRVPITVRCALAAGVLAYALAFCGSRGLWYPDEGRYACVALEMLRDGDWIHPRLHPEQPHYTKPPLTYWALASSLAVFGRNETAARLPNALAFAATVLVMLLLGRRLLPERAWLPPLVYATSIGPYLAASVVTTDTLLTLWEALAGLAFVVAWRETGRRQRGAVLLLWTALSLAFLTKGPPGLLPVLAMAAFVVARGGVRELPRFAPVSGVALFALVGLSWYVKVAVDQPELWASFVEQEVVSRVASSAHHRNSEWYKGPVLYGVTLLLGALPWTVPLVRSWASILRSGSVVSRSRASLSREETLFPMLWLSLPLVVFLVARSRLPLYVLPLFPPLCLLVARAIPGRGKLPRMVWPALAVWVVLLAATRGVAARLSVPNKDDRALSAEIRRLAGPMGEVAFVDATPRYGISFYLDVEVERLVVVPVPDPSGRLETVAEEWQEAGQDREEPRVYLVSPEAAEDFERVAASGGRTPVRLGEVAKLVVYHAPLTGLR